MKKLFYIIAICIYIIWCYFIGVGTEGSFVYRFISTPFAVLIYVGTGIFIGAGLMGCLIGSLLKIFK